MNRDRLAGAYLLAHSLAVRSGPETQSQSQVRRRAGAVQEAVILVLGAANRPLRAREIHAAAQQLAGQPLSWSVTGGNRNDVTQLIPLVERIPPVGGKVGRPRRRPNRVAADRGYDHDKYRRELRRRRITPEIARRQTEHGSGLGR